MKYQIQELAYIDQIIVTKEPMPVEKTVHSIAIVVHVFYIDVWKEITEYLEQLDMAYDLYVSVPESISESDISGMIKEYPNMHIYMTENRGRDVLPFLQIMNIIGIDTYNYICKLHTKKTNDSALGNVWRKLLYFDLLGSTTIVNTVLDLFNQNSDIGIVTGKNTILDSERYDYGNTTKIDKLIEMSGFTFDDEYFFAGGTMFWIRPVLLSPVVKLFQNDLLDFEEESGQKDHTLAHAIERYFGIVCQLSYKKIVESPSQYSKLDDEILNEVAGLVLSQQYVGEDVFIKQKHQLECYREAMKFKEEELRLKGEETKYLEETAQSLRLKNRVKKLIPEKVQTNIQKGQITIKKVIQLLKVIQKNPRVLNKAFYYLRRGEIGYLLAKTKEKSNKNLEVMEKLSEIYPSKIFTKFNPEEYAIKNMVVDIIIPVYNGFEFLEALFDSIEKNTLSPYRLIVINDCSPDVAVKPYLEKRLLKHPTAIFIDHFVNQGFLKSVNEAYSYTSNHFVILNTDTEVPAYWMERLMFPIIQMDKIASTTPFTNSGEIASFPNFVADNEIFEALSVEILDESFKEINPKNFYEEVPTGVGFCMGVNYNLTKEIGLFVEDTFGKGYGEENDWCQRAIKQGYKNYLVPNLFVYHKHGGSFTAEEKAKLLKENIVTLQDRHPNYGQDVQAYIQRDPHYYLRKVLVMTSSSHNKGLHIVFDHDIGGGANIYGNEITDKYMQEEKNLLLIKFDYYTNLFKFSYRYGENSFDFKITAWDEVKILLSQFNIEEIFLNSLVSYKYSYDILADIHALVEQSKAKLIIPFHDYYAICPSYTLLNNEGVYCNIPSLEACNACMKKNTLEWKNYFSETVNINLWRELWSKLLHQSHEVLCFSSASKEILLKAYPEVSPEKIMVIPHTVAPLTPVSPLVRHTTTVTIGILGAINYAKGSQIVKDLVTEIERKDLDIKIVIVGEVSEQMKSKHLHVTGRYERRKLPEITTREEIDIFLIPSIWPETFSYTTQEIMMMDMPLMVFDLGAPAERVKAYDKGVVLEQDYVENVIRYVSEIKI